MWKREDGPVNTRSNSEIPGRPWHMHLYTSYIFGVDRLVITQCCPTHIAHTWKTQTTSFSLSRNKQYRARLQRHINSSFRKCEEFWLLTDLLAPHQPTCMSPFFFLWRCRPIFTEFWNFRSQTRPAICLPLSSQKLPASLCAHLHTGFYPPWGGRGHLFSLLLNMALLLHPSPQIWGDHFYYPMY